MRRWRQYACRVGRETDKVTFDQSAASLEKLRQPRELRDDDQRIHISQIEFSAWKGHVARAVGQPLDAMEAQHFHALRLAVVADDHVQNGEKALGPGDYFVDCADLGQLERDFDGGGRRRERADRASAAELREGALERFHPWAAGDVAGAQYVGDAGDGLLVDQ